MRSGFAIRILTVISMLLFALPMPTNAQNDVVGIDTGLRGDDYGANNFPIGFTFNYWGVDHTTFGVSTNGWISLRNTATGNPYTNSDFPMSGDFDGMIAPFFDDIRTDSSGQPEGVIFYLTIGQEPNRQLVVQYHDMYFYSTGLPMGTFEVILYESTNQIKFQYRYLRDPDSLGNSATIGIDKPGNDEYVRYSFDTNSLAEQKATLFAPDGQGGYTMDADAPYSWVDISGLTSLPPDDGGEYAASDITFTWEPTSVANAYRIDISTRADQSGIIASFPLDNVTTFTYSDNLIEGTTYYARVAASLNYGGTYQNPSLFSDGITIDKTPPVADAPTAYQGDEASIADFHFSGSDNFIIESYHIQIASDSLFANLLADTTIDSGIYSYQTSTGEALYARAYATDGAGNEGDYSEAAGPFEIPLPFPPSGLVAFSSSDYTVHVVQERAEITVILSEVSSNTVTVDYATGNGTATAGSDYTAVSGTLTFNPGETGKTFTVPILDNGTDTHDETFNVILSNPAHANLGTPASSQVKITRAQGVAPVITRPAPDTAFADSEITVRGNTDSGATVEIFVNGVSQGTDLASASGYFSLSGVRISQGENAITAVATNAYGVTGPASEPVNVTLDPRPEVPGGLTTAPGDTVATITWNANSEPDIHGYHIYRDGQRLNYELLTETTFTDSCLTNGREYTYTVTAVDANESESLKTSSVKISPVAGTAWE